MLQRQQGGEVQTGQIHPVGHVVILGHQRVDFAQCADDLTVRGHISTAAGMEGGTLGIGDVADAVHAEGLQNGFHSALQAEEVHTVAVGAQN